MAASRPQRFGSNVTPCPENIAGSTQRSISPSLGSWVAKSVARLKTTIRGPGRFPLWVCAFNRPALIVVTIELDPVCAVPLFGDLGIDPRELVASVIDGIQSIGRHLERTDHFLNRVVNQMAATT